MISYSGYAQKPGVEFNASDIYQQKIPRPYQSRDLLLYFSNYKLLLERLIKSYISILFTVLLTLDAHVPSSITEGIKTCASVLEI